MCAKKTADSRGTEICAYPMRGGIIKEEQQLSPDLVETLPRANERKSHSRDVGEATRAPVRKEGVIMSDDTELGLHLDAIPGKSLQIDTAKYQKYLDDPSLSDAQKEEIITALWQIIICFVDLGFGVSPHQQACGQLNEAVDLKAKKDSNESKPLTLKDAFNAVAAE